MSHLDPALVFTLTANAVLGHRMGLDDAQAFWRDWRGYLPLFTAEAPTPEGDPFAAPPEPVVAAVADESPGLPGLVGILRRHGIDTVRLAPATPLGPFELPRVDRAVRRRVGRGSAAVLQEGSLARAVVASRDGEVFDTVASAPVHHSPMVAATVTEAGRALREAVLAALAGLAEDTGDFEAELRDWQASATAPARRQLDLPASLLASPDHARLLELALLMEAALEPMAPHLIQAGTPLFRLSRATSAALVAASS